MGQDREGIDERPTRRGSCGAAQVTQYLKCYVCNHVFTEDESAGHVEREWSEAWGVRAITTTRELMCPETKCGSTQIEDFTPCIHPECLNPPEEGFDECTEHIEANRPAKVSERIRTERREVMVDLARRIA